MIIGYVDLTVTVDDKTFFYSRLYIRKCFLECDLFSLFYALSQNSTDNHLFLESPDIKKNFDVQIVDDDFMTKSPLGFSNEEAIEFVVQWHNHKLSWDTNAYVRISLWSYYEGADVNYPSLIYITDLANQGVPNTGSYKVSYTFKNLLNFPRYDFSFGFIAINLSRADRSPILWSKALPIGWFMKPYWEREFGKSWQMRLCSQWFEREYEADRFAATVFKCPCTIEQAELDRGRFSPDIECNVIDKKCDALHHGAQHCVRTARPSIGGSGQVCCYDDYGELLQTADTMYGGRPSRAFVYGKHPFKMRMMVPTFSYWLHDIMPYYYCCKWAEHEENSDTCQMYNYWRTSQDCSSYQPPGIASVFGDPHFITFDSFNYTFKAKGEFVLVHVDSPVHKLDIQGRFERMDPKVNATHLTAIAAKGNVSSIIEFRVRPIAARWQYQMFIIGDKEYYYFWDDNMRTINMKGVTLYQPAGIRNMSHIIAMFDSGAGIELMVTPAGSLSVQIYLPNTFLNITRGLLGNFF